MQILTIISRLLDYPTQMLQAHSDELKALVLMSKDIPPALRKKIAELINTIYSADILDAQEYYTGLFDRGRALSLLLFEHVHGESRDRGQAMVDLMAQYEQHGLHISVRELPDYIPLYLEFLAQRPPLQAREGIGDIAHILAMLSARLQERNSAYATLFDALLIISGSTIDIDALRKQASQETPDNTPQALDKVWEEQAVTFGAGDAHNNQCPHHSGGVHFDALNAEQSMPLHWVEPASAANR